MARRRRGRKYRGNSGRTSDSIMAQSDSLMDKIRQLLGINAPVPSVRYAYGSEVSTFYERRLAEMSGNNTLAGLASGQLTGFDGGQAILNPLAYASLPPTEATKPPVAKLEVLPVKTKRSILLDWQI